MKNMMFEDLRINRHILCIDLMSFYASVECILRGLDPLTAMLVVADEERGDGAITLAATPSVKKYGIKARGRIFEIDPKLRKQIKIVKPRMQKYVQFSLKINNIYRELFDEEDIFVYSIDESFIDISNYLKLYNTTPAKMAIAIKRKILRELGLHVTIGYGPNMVLAKFALDIDSKHSPNQIAFWTYDNFSEKLWPITDFTKIWGIGKRRAKRLHALGITSIGELAKYPVEKMSKQMGVIGEELILHANGIDLSRVQDSNKLDRQQSFGLGQTLSEDLVNEEVSNAIYEMVFDTVMKMRSFNYKCSHIDLMLKFNKKYDLAAVSRSLKLDYATSNYNTLKAEFGALFVQIYPRGIGVRQIAISLGELEDNCYEQLDLFDKTASKRIKLDEAMVKIRQKYGKSSIMTANSKYDKATGYERNKMIGGHNANTDE